MFGVKYIRILIALLLLFSVSGFSQNNTDSLISVLKTEKSDIKKVELLNTIIENFINTDIEKANYYADELWKLSKRIDNQKGIAISNFSLGKIYEIKGQFEKAKKYFAKALKYYEEIKNKSGIAEVEKHLGVIYESKGDYSLAIKHYLNAMKIFIDLNDKQGMASCNNSLGNIYYLQKKNTKALEYFNVALKLVKELNNKNAEAIVLNGIGLVYDNLKEYAKAMDFFQKSLEINNELGNYYGAAFALTNIANVYSNEGNYNLALKFHNDAMSYYKEFDDQFRISMTYMNIGNVYKEMGDYFLAGENIIKSLDFSINIRDYEGIKLSYKILADLNVRTGNYLKAYEYLQLFSDYKDSVLNEESEKMINELQEMHNAEQREKENEILTKNNQLKDSELEKADEKSRRQAIQLIALSAGFLLILILAIVVLRGYRQKKKANIQLAKQNDEIKHQKEVIEEKNRDIMDSIKYAKRIQEAILPPDKVVKANLENSFILFKPKDIVSGDFYWMETRDNIILFAAVDCTGHGVPGAFMSIVGHSGLSQAVNEYGITEPGKILDKLNERVRETLRQTDKTEVKDGMDIALVGLDLDRMKGMFAAANNPMYLIRKKGIGFITDKKEFEPDKEGTEHVLFEIKATKQPIGATEDTKSFVNHTFDLLKGDRIYVFSDGYCDQFGGSENKKFKYATLKKLLLEKMDMPIHDQKAFLNDTIVDWMKDTEQIDDICVIGVEV